MSAGPDATDQPVVCVQGLGFVGMAMTLATASARRSDGSPAFRVVGVELDNEAGRERVELVNAGRLPIQSSDQRMEKAMREAFAAGNLRATTNPDAYGDASVAIVDIGLDVTMTDDGPTVDFGGLRAAVRSLAERVPVGALIIVETTVPPGTCEKVIAPEIDEVIEQRGLPPASILLAHAYERVMPGPQYLDSIVNYWRVYAGHTPEAADACERFLSQVVHVDEYPLTRLGSTTASETAKVLENSYRAMNIAFMEEWGRFSEEADIDLFQAIDAIRMRPTHANIRQPGFGVGGYCLTKDPLFAEYGARELLGFKDLEFPFSERAVEVNKEMPLVSLRKLDELLDGLGGRRILLLGVSYREGVADMRETPAGTFISDAKRRGAEVVAQDPLLGGSRLPEGDVVQGELPTPAGFDAVVFAVGHSQYQELDLLEWLGKARPVIVDANRVLGAQQLDALAAQDLTVWSVGRGLGTG